MTMREEIVQYLKELGETKEEAAAKLFSLGIKGKKGSCSSCPIAEYLSLKMGRQVEVFNRAMSVGFFPLDFPEGFNGVFSFIIAFDCGVYPELVI